MERAVPYNSLRYIWELAAAGKRQEITPVRPPHRRITGNKQKVVAAEAESIRRQHNKGEQWLSETTQRMLRALPAVCHHPLCAPAQPAYSQLPSSPSRLSHALSDPESVSNTKIGPPMLHVLLVANMCSSSGSSACRTRHMRSLLPAVKGHLLYHTKRWQRFSSFCTAGASGPLKRPHCLGHFPQRHAVVYGLALFLRQHPKYQKAGPHHSRCFRRQPLVAWGVYKWMMRQA